MKELKIKIDHFVQKLEKDENVIYVAYDQTLIGVISIFDRIRVWDGSCRSGIYGIMGLRTLLC